MTLYKFIQMINEITIRVYLKTKSIKKLKFTFE